MLPKSKRLSTELFQKVIDKGRSFHSSFLLLKVVYTQEPSRFAVSVPKKVSKTAAGRNLLKRQIYSAIRGLEKRTESGLMVTLITKVGIEKLSFEKLSKEVEEIFVKSGIIK